MIRILWDYFRRPYRIKQPPPWRIGGVVTLLVLFVLGVFQPFGIADVEGGRKAIILGIAVLSSIGGLGAVLFLFPRLFTRYYAAENWTVGKNMLDQLGIVWIIGLCNGGLQVLWSAWRLGHLPANAFDTFWQLVLAVFLVSPIPLVVTAFMARNQQLKSYLQEVEEINRYLRLQSEERMSGGMMASDKRMGEISSLKTSSPETSSLRTSSFGTSSLITSPLTTPLPKSFSAETSLAATETVLLAGSTKDYLSLDPHALLYLEACGNYVKIYYEAEGKAKQRLLRATIKQMEGTLRPYRFILRCHRAFLVNTDRVIQVQGNSQGYRLLFRETAEEVPVSRAYTGIVRERFR